MKAKLEKWINILGSLFFLHSFLFITGGLFAVCIYGGDTIAPTWAVIELGIYFLHAAIVMVLIVLDSII